MHTRGAAGPGEVLVRVRGGSEALLAWSQAARTTTDANGYYRLSAGQGRWSGTWYVGFTASGAWYLNAAGPSTWVGMH
ncbi:hypothetical protein EDD99_3934 [Streptomyces sp. 846.5]|nr:hypothetical protein EDD99_3934 [Streptomyces sp. 846.5]